MSTSGFCLRHLVFLSPRREPAGVEFGRGLNVVYGASDTGKSFLVEAIDFMLGGRLPLRDIPERLGFDRVLLGIETYEGTPHTIFRSIDGGRFRLFEGLHVEEPPSEVAGRTLGEQHSERNADNLSSVLLGLVGLAGRRVRRNKGGDTNSLSFRNLARLVIVTETEITGERSPLSDGNPINDTPNLATFKLLLTGTDDSALVAAAPRSPEEQTKAAQAELLDQLLAEQRERLRELTRSPAELSDQLGRIEAALADRAQQLAATEEEFRRLSKRRRDLRQKLEGGRDRRSEVASLLERFDLLDRHYHSDMARLRAIEESGSLFVALGHGPCPLCGAEPLHQRRDRDCDGNVEAVVLAARAEITKIELLRAELAETISALTREAASLDRSLPQVDEEARKASQAIDATLAPQLTRMRASYAELADKRGEVREALALLRTVRDMEARRATMERDDDRSPETQVASAELPAVVAEAFAQQVERVLKAWHVPGAERVFFDQRTRDLIIAGKPRTARGKGLRAITHAAFTLGLMDYCRDKGTPHPGFVVLDSPLLAYRAPEGEDDDLRGTDLDVHFYNSLAAQSGDRQTIIVENDDPPEDTRTRRQVTMFTKSPTQGRYGLFPVAVVTP